MRIKILKVEEKKGNSQKKLLAVIIKGNIKNDAIYDLQEVDEYTDQQRALFEPLCRRYFDSLCCTREVGNWEELRDDIKRSLGMGYEEIVYSDDNHRIRHLKYKEKDQLPKSVREDYHGGNKDRIELVLRSTTTYTRLQFMKMTDSLLREMIVNGVLLSRQGKWFGEVLEEIGFVE